MNLKQCSCGAVLSTETSQYVGEANGLDYWECGKCHSTQCVKTSDFISPELDKIRAHFLKVKDYGTSSR